MSTTTADRNLLFGILALQMDFIRRDELLQAMNAWVLEKSKPLGQILLERSALSDDSFALLDALVDKHLEMHGNDPEQSLATVSSIGSVRDELTRIGDGELNATLAFVSATRYTGESGESGDSPARPTNRDSGGAAHRYRIVRPFARGGLGQVSVAEDEELHREVALKELQDRLADDPDCRARFMLEAEITGNLEHPGIVPVYGLGCYADGRPFYAMRFIRGHSLKEAVDEFHERQQDSSPGHRALELRKLLGRFVDVCNAIQYAHSRGVLHRDLKPGNIMLGKYGETLVVDWGLAKSIERRHEDAASGEVTLKPSSAGDSGATQMGAAVGTPAYMGPEQAQGRLDAIGPASDVYSLGATLYHVLTGRAPFSGGGVAEVLDRVQRGDFLAPRQLNREIPKPLEAVCLKAMALRKEDRYATPQELADDIERWMADEPTAALPESLPQRAGRWMRRHRSWTAAGGAALVLVTAVSIVATLLVNSAREQEARLRQLTQLLREFDVRLLEEQQQSVRLSPGTLVELERQLEQIRPLSPDDAAVRRSKLLDQFAAGVADILRQSHYSDEDDAAFQTQLAQLEVRANGQGELAATIERLREQRAARLGVWDPLFELRAPFDTSIAAVFSPDQAQAIDERLRRAGTVSSDYETVLTTVACPPGNVELRAAFDQSWAQAGVLGLVLNGDEQHRYEFLVAAPQFDYRDRGPRYLAELPDLQSVVSKLDSPEVKIVILRDDELLAERMLRLAPGRLTLAARREGEQLSFAVNNLPSLQFHDPYPLPSSVVGRFGLYWPRAVQLESLSASRQRASRTPSPIERGDELYAQAKFGEALAEYRALGDEVEAHYKAALCHEALRDVDSYIEALEQVAARSPEDAESAAEGQWRLLAAARLLQREIAAKNWPAVGARVRELSIYYDFQAVARLLPSAQREEILQNVRRDGQRFRVVFERFSNREDMATLQQLDALFNVNAAERRALRWRIADMHRVEGERGKALEIVAELIEDKPGEEPVPIRERIALVADLVWMLRLEGREDDALAEIHRWLVVGQPGPEETYREEYLPLLLERARLHLAAQRRAEAARDLQEFFQRVPAESISHAEYAEGRLMEGMIEEDAGNLRQAREAWLKGARRYWHEGYLSPRDIAQARGVESIHVGNSLSCDTIIAAWTGEVTSDEAVQMMNGYLAGSGTADGILVRLLRNSLSPEFLRSLALTSGASPRIRQYQRRGLLRQQSLREDCIHGMVAVLYVAVNQSAFDGRPYPEALEELMCQQATNLVETFERGELPPADLRMVLELWRGHHNERGWEKLRGQLDPKLSATMALIYGRTSARLGKPEQARPFFEYVKQHEPTGSPLYGDAEEQLKSLDKPAG